MPSQMIEPLDQSSETGAQPPASPSLRDYLDGAIRLRQAATWNKFDIELPKDVPRRVIPVVDADVVRLFMAPADETRYVSPFRDADADSVTQKAWNDPLVLVAAATAEFTFLTGTIQILDRPVHNWGEPLRITPEHSNDLDTMLSQIEAKISESHDVIEELEDQAIEKLDRFLDGAARGEADALNDLVKNLPSSLRKLYLGPVFEAQRWIRLVEDQLLLKLEGLREATAEILNPDEQIMERWREPLFGSLIEGSSVTQHQVRDRARERARRDARSLATVTVLNEAGLRMGRDKGWRAILISGDEHMHRVYSRWAWKEMGSSLQPERYVLRRPLQYSPVLNVASMSSEKDNSAVFQKLTKALDLTFDDMLFGGSKEIRNPYLLEYHWQSMRRRWLRTADQQRIQERLQEHLNNCSSIWLEAINAINLRSHPYLTRDYRRLLEKLSAALDEPDARSALVNFTEDVLYRLVGEHFQLWLEETTAELARTARPMRMPFLVRREFPELSDAGGSTTRFLYGEPESPTMMRHEPDELNRVANAILNSTDVVRATFLTAILAAASGSFVRASRLMARAEELSKKKPIDPELHAEMNYFAALILRLNMKERKDHDLAREKLKAAVARGSTDPFEEARAHSEAAALELQWFGTDAMRPINREFTKEQKSHLKDAGEHLAKARNSSTWPPKRDRFGRELAQQIVANEIALNAYRKVSGETPNLKMVAWAQQQFEALFGSIDDEIDYITKLWRLMAAWLLDPSSTKNVEALWKHCESALADTSIGDMPVADHNDLTRIKSYLERPADARR